MRRLFPPAVIAITFAVSLYGADFWKVKEPSQWSDEEVGKMLTKSPWAKSLSTQTINTASAGGGSMGGGAGGGDAGGGGGGEGGGGGRGGGRNMGASMPSGPETPPIVVRWESAAPVRAAQDRKKFGHSTEITQWSQENYVVSLTGFQTRSARRGAPAGGGEPGGRGAPTQGRQGGGAPSGRAAPTEGGQRSGVPSASVNPNADLPDFRDAVIKHDNKQSLPVDKIMVIRTPQGPGLYLLFSRKNAISAETKEVTVEFSVNRLTFKAKFKVKDMEYHGKPEL